MDTMIKGLDYAWDHARDQAGLMYHVVDAPNLAKPKGSAAGV